MGCPLCLQPWISIAGNGNTVMQDEADWLDVGPFKDLAVYAQVSYVLAQASTTTLQVQTSPLKDDASFAGGLNAVGSTPYIANYSFAASPTLGVQALQIVRFAAATQTAPLSRWVRWRVNFPAAETNICFRIWLNVNAMGR